MKKLLLTILSLACSLSMALGIVGCSLGDLGTGNGGENPPAHSHTYSETYSSDDTYHWLDATCEHTDLVDKKGEHSYDEGVLNEDGTLLIYTCSVCGKTVTEEVQNKPPFFGIGGKLNIDYTVKNWDNIATNFIYQFVAGLSEGSFNLDFMGIGSRREGDIAMFIRDGIIYIADNTDQVDVGDLSEIVGELDKFEHSIIDLKSIISEASSAVQIPSLLKMALSLLQEPAIFNLFNSFTVGGYNYISIESSQNNGNTVTTYDFRKSIDNLLAKLKEVGAYLDANMDNATVKSLYNSEVFKHVVEPLFKEVNATDLESVLNSVKDLYEVATESEFPIEIFEAGDMTAYEYIAKYLDVEIEIEGEIYKVGDLKLKDIIYFPEMEDEEFTFVDFVSSLEMTLDQMLPIAKLSVVTEGVSTEMGKLLGVGFEIQANTINEYEDEVNTHSTYVKYDFDFIYEKDVFIGLSFKGDIDETDSEYGNSEVGINASILPTENGYEVKFKAESYDDYSENEYYVLEFVANFNVYFDEDGDFEEFEVLANCKENNKTLFELDSFIAVGYDGEGENKKFKDFEIEIAFDSYFKDGAEDISYNFETFVECTYENDLLTQVDLSMTDEMITHAYNDGFSYSRGESSRGMLFTAGVRLAYNEDGLLSNAVLYANEIGDVLTIDLSYLENTDKVISVKASLPNDFAVLEVKCEYTEDLEVSKVEFIVDFMMTGEMGEDGEDVIEPYQGQIKLSVCPIYKNEELVGVNGEIYFDTRDERIEGSYEINLYTEEPTFIELPEINGEKLTLEDIMEMFGLGDLGGAKDEQATNPYA